MGDVDALLGVGTAEEKALLDKYLREDCATVIQKHARRYIQRVKILELMEATYEKILDPRRKCYFYYNINTDRSSWKKPALLLKADLSRIAPTYTLDQAATKIQSLCRCRPALKRTRNLYKLFVKEMVDQAGAKYYYNPLTARSMWELPSFMGGKLDGHVYGKKKEEAKEEEKDEDSDDDDDDDSDDGSNLSDDSSLVRQRRREARKFPRSKAQAIVDACEDNQVRRALSRPLSRPLSSPYLDPIKPLLCPPQPGASTRRARGTQHHVTSLLRTDTHPHPPPRAPAGPDRARPHRHRRHALHQPHLRPDRAHHAQPVAQQVDRVEPQHPVFGQFGGPRRVAQLPVHLSAGNRGASGATHSRPTLLPSWRCDFIDGLILISVLPRTVPCPVCPTRPSVPPHPASSPRPVPRAAPRPVPCVFLRRTCA